MKNETLSRFLLFSALFLVAAIVIWAFTLVGSPSFNRKLSADKNRIEDLQQISYGIEQYFYQQKKLPDNLKELEKIRYWYGQNNRLEDPTSQKPYGYKRKDAYSYELCGEFELNSKEAELEKPPYNYYESIGTNWYHDVGHSCFSLEIPIEKRASKVN
jgi:hypothetical protein